MLILQGAYLIDNRIQAEFAVSRPYINPVAGRGDLFQSLLVQLRDYYIALPVFQQSSLIRYGLAFGRTYADTEDFDSHFRRLTRRGNRVVFMIFPVGYEDNRAAALALRAETPYRGIDCIAYGCSLHRD